MRLILSVILFLLNWSAMGQFNMEDSLTYHKGVKTVTLTHNNGDVTIVRYDKKGQLREKVHRANPKTLRPSDSTVWMYFAHGTDMRYTYVLKDESNKFERHLEEIIHHKGSVDSSVITWYDGRKTYEIRQSIKTPEAWVYLRRDPVRGDADTVINYLNEQGQIYFRVSIMDFLGDISTMTDKFTLYASGKPKMILPQSNTSGRAFVYDDEDHLIKIISHSRVVKEHQMSDYLRNEYGPDLILKKDGYWWQRLVKEITYEYYD